MHKKQPLSDGVHGLEVLKVLSQAETNLKNKAEGYVPYELYPSSFIAFYGLNCVVDEQAKFGHNIKMGNNVIIYGNVSLGSNNITIGDNVILGKPPLLPASSTQQANTSNLSPLKIEDDVVIGAGSIICPGIKYWDKNICR